MNTILCNRNGKEVWCQVIMGSDAENLYAEGGVVYTYTTILKTNDDNKVWLGKHKLGIMCLVKEIGAPANTTFETPQEIAERLKWVSQHNALPIKLDPKQLEKLYGNNMSRLEPLLNDCFRNDMIPLMIVSRGSSTWLINLPDTAHCTSIFSDY